jgi:hypothetical protein
MSTFLAAVGASFIVAVRVVPGLEAVGVAFIFPLEPTLTTLADDVPRRNISMIFRISEAISASKGISRLWVGAVSAGEGEVERFAMAVFAVVNAPWRAQDLAGSIAVVLDHAVALHILRVVEGRL